MMTLADFPTIFKRKGKDMTGAERLVMEKVAKESSMVSDFVAGLDPTGVSTFKNSLGNEKNHGAHKAMGDIGGFLGGAVAGAAVPAAVLGGTALALKGKNPDLAKDLRLMAKGSLDAYNPKRVKRYATSFGKLSKLKGATAKGIGMSDDLLRKTDEIEKLYKKRDTIGMFEGKQEIQDLMSKLKKNRAASEVISEDLAKNHYVIDKGDTVADGASRALTALTSLGTAGMTGGLNASSAHLQYDTAQKERQKNMQQNFEKRAGWMSDLAHELSRKPAGFASEKILNEAGVKLNPGEVQGVADILANRANRKVQKQVVDLSKAAIKAAPAAADVGLAKVLKPVADKVDEFYLPRRTRVVEANKLINLDGSGKDLEVNGLKDLITNFRINQAAKKTLAEARDNSADYSNIVFDRLGRPRVK